MSKYVKLKSAWYDEETGESHAELHTDLGVFYGHAHCCFEDYEFQSKFFGPWLAEMSARIQYLKAKSKRLVAQITILDELREKYDTKLDNRQWTILIKEANRLEEEHNKVNQAIATIKESVKANIAARDALKKQDKKD